MSRRYTSSPPSASMACGGTALLYFTLLYFNTNHSERQKANVVNMGRRKRHTRVWSENLKGNFSVAHRDIAERIILKRILKSTRLHMPVLVDVTVW
jgi:hypothetical protein